MQSPSIIAENIGRAWGAFLERDARPQSPHASVYASQYRECERRIVYELTQPETLPPWPVEVLAKFRRGDDRERDLLSDLARVGRNADPPFKVVAQQERFELKDHRGRVAITGKVDARIDLGNGARPPLEIKAWAPTIVERLETFPQLFDNPWTKAGAYQLLAYLFAAGEAFGFLLLDRSGLPKLLPVELEPHFDRVETFLAKAERVLDARQAGTLPTFLEDADECRRCPFFGCVCNPPIGGGDAFTVLTDPALETALERREAIKAVGKEFADLDDEIKTHLRGVTAAVIGKFAIRGTWGKQSRLELPTAVKQQYTRVDPRGRFTLDIVKVG